MCNNFGFDSINSGSAPISQNFYGSYFDTTTQTALLPDTPYAMKLNNIDFENGVQLVAGSQIEALNTGFYNLQFSAQLYRTAGSSLENIDIWIRKNGFDIPSTSTKVNFNAQNRYEVAAWNWFVQMNAGESVQIMWSTTDIRIQLRFEPANLVVPYPEIPSVITTINKVS